MKSKKMTSVNDNEILKENTLYAYVGENPECIGLVVLVIHASDNSIDVVIMSNDCENDYTIGAYFEDWGVVPGSWELYKSKLILEND